jgi:hypothetical protein
MCERAIPAPSPEAALVCTRARGQVRPANADALAELEFHWGSAYRLAVTDSRWTARRRDGRSGTLTGQVPEGLRRQTLADYAAMRVSRDLP